MTSPQIYNLFDQFSNVDIILAGIIDTRTGATRNWEFMKTHLNIFHPQAIFVRNQPNLFVPTLETLLQLMVGKTTLVMNEAIVKITTEAPEPMCEKVIEAYFKSIEIKNQMYQKYRPKLNIIQNQYPRRIAIVGPKEEIKPLGECFKELNWMVALYPTHPNNATRRKIGTELMLDTPWPDHILIIHNYDAIDVDSISKQTPIHFYAKQGVHPSLPLNWEGQGIFFHAYLGAVEQYKACHPYLMGHVRHTELVPYAWYPPAFRDFPKEHDIEFGFMGSLDSLPHPYDCERRDYLSVHIRDLRAKYVAYAKRELGLQVFPRMGKAQYVHFLNRTKLILNVSAIFGFLTERQFHALACGGILVQNYYKYLDTLGYKDMVNCLLFDSEASLKTKILWARSNPHALKNIQQRGKQLAQKHTLQVRTKQLLEAMIKHERRLLD